MKNLLFIVSHLGSGSDDFVKILNNNHQCDIRTSDTKYEHPSDIEWMFKNKNNFSNHIYGDHLLYNTSFYCKNLYHYCKFIYIIRSARGALNDIYKLNKFKSSDNIINYYKFRLRRMCEMARDSSNYLFLTYDDLANGSAFSLVENYLGLSDKLNFSNYFEYKEENNLNENIIFDAQNCYERYYYYLKNVQNITN